MMTSLHPITAGLNFYLHIPPFHGHGDLLALMIPLINRQESRNRYSSRPAFRLRARYSHILDLISSQPYSDQESVQAKLAQT